MRSVAYQRDAGDAIPTMPYGERMDSPRHEFVAIRNERSQRVIPARKVPEQCCFSACGIFKINLA